MIPHALPEHLALPALGKPAQRPGFPVVATLAPVAASLGIWAFTGSPFSLLFAALGPVVALGGLADGRRQRRRTARRETVKALASIARLVERVADIERAERVRLAELAPPPAQLCQARHTIERWAQQPGVIGAAHEGDRPIPVYLGRAASRPVVELTGEDDDEELSEPVLRALAELRARAGEFLAAPRVADARDGIGVLGPEPIARAVARSLALQLAANLSPLITRMSAPRDESWVTALPHAVSFESERAYRLRTADAELAVIGWADRPEGLPAGGRVVVQLARNESASWPSPASSPSAPTANPNPEYEAIGRVRAAELAAALDAIAEARGLRAAARTLPQTVRLAELLAAAPSDPVDDGSLRATIGRDADGIVELDLVGEGPHAVVAGTTGTGKSELLVSWVLAMAARHPVDAVNFLLVDFKGGAAFAPLAGLPHVVGTVSDLDARRSRRAIESLRAELLRRERLLAQHGVRSLEELGPGVLARLVIVVDEFAAVVSGQPELHEVFVDLAARGRSLGLHLILCTQRPSGVVRDSVLANVTLRLSLRVTDRGDSLAMLGSDAASRLPPDSRGRALIADGSGTVREVQLALAERTDAERLSETAGSAETRVWCDPLPDRVPLDSLRGATDVLTDAGHQEHGGDEHGADEHGADEHGGDEPGIPFGRVDLPAEQRQPVARHDPHRDGHLLVLGAAGSGKTTLLATLAAGSPCRVLPADPADAWGVLDELLTPELASEAVAGTAVEAAARDRALLLVDDLDVLVDRLDPDLRHEFVDRLSRVARESRAIALVATAQRLSGGLTRLAGLFDERILLRQPSRDEHVLAGGDGSAFDPRLPPGAGTWRGAVVQIAIGETRLPAPSTRRLPSVRLGAAPLAIVANRPRELARRLEATGVRVVRIGEQPAPDEGELRVSGGGGAVVLLGDPDSWQAEWALLGLVRREFRLVLIGCAAAELRAISRARDVAPPLGDRPGECWLVDGGVVRRALLEL